jgi:hypothetical protein
VAKKWMFLGSNPHFGAILGFWFDPRKRACFHALNTGRCSRLHLRYGVSPPRAIHTGEKKHQAGNSWILTVGFVDREDAGLMLIMASI